MKAKTFFLFIVRVIALTVITLLYFKDVYSDEISGFISRVSLFQRQNPIGLQASQSFELPINYGYSETYKCVSKSITPSVTFALNPAYYQFGPQVAWVPALPLQLSAGWQRYRFLGVNGALLEFENRSADYSDTIRDKMKDENRAVWSDQLYIGLTIRAKVKRLILRHEVRFAKWFLPDKNKWYLDWEYDLLVGGNDELLINRTVVLVQLNQKYVLGPVFEHARAVKSKGDHSRISLLMLYQPDAGLLKNSEIFLLPGFHLDDPNRRCEFLFVMGLEKTFNL